MASDHQEAKHESTGEFFSVEGRKSPLLLTVDVGDSRDPEIRCMTVLRNVMEQFQRDTSGLETLTIQEQIRVAQWFKSRYGDLDAITLRSVPDCLDLDSLR